MKMGYAEERGISFEELLELDCEIERESRRYPENLDESGERLK